MTIPKQPQPVKLLTSIVTADSGISETVCSKMTMRFGPVDFTSDALAFDFTDYYENEMGRGMFRHILSFQELIAPDLLPSIKNYTNELEGSVLRADGTRTVNIDPGYIALGHMILATCKGFAHRPYLRDGIYADLTLIFKDRTFNPLEWTFPDYGSEQYIKIINQIRKIYYEQLQDLQII